MCMCVCGARWPRLECACVRAHIKVCMCVCMHAYAQTNMHTYKHTCIQISIRTYMHTNLHATIQTDTRTCMHECAHTNNYTSIHTHPMLPFRMKWVGQEKEYVYIYKRCFDTSQRQKETERGKGRVEPEFSVTLQGGEELYVTWLISHSLFADSPLSIGFVCRE